MKKMNRLQAGRTASVVLSAFMLACMTTGCGQDDTSETENKNQNDLLTDQTSDTAEKAAEPFSIKKNEPFEIRSENLSSGVWDTVITNTENGKNHSPQLSWEPVDGAESYVIYMTDKTISDWMHWKSNKVTDTSLPEGWASDEEYIGPYPPNGTHTYEVLVFALKNAHDEIEGDFDRSNVLFEDCITELDKTPDGSFGNIISYGRISGTYTHGD